MKDEKSLFVSIRLKRLLITQIAIEFELEADGFSSSSTRRVIRDCNIEIPI